MTNPDNILIPPVNTEQEAYFLQTDYLSNSTLKAAVDEYEGRSKPDNLDEIFEFGRLVHHIALEPEKADRFHDNWDQAFGMANALLENRLTKMFLEMGGNKYEHEFYRTINGVKRRCKCDFFNEPTNTIIDFKGLASTSKNSFLNAIQFFDIDQQAAWYIDTTGAEKFIVIGVSKKQKKVAGKSFYPTWEHVIRIGSEDYIKGRLKYERALQIIQQSKVMEND